MCGIHATISVNNAAELSEDLRQSLTDRGPDHLGVAERQLPHITLKFTSTVLALRGDHVAKQPFEDTESGSVLCWNGEAWKLDDQRVKGNDGEAIFSRLVHNQDTEPAVRKNHVLSVLRSIQGPFAFLYFDAPGQCLYFGRDRLGRRSLLLNQAPDGKSVALSSIAGVPNHDWSEVQADGIYTMALLPTPTAVGGEPVLGIQTFRDDWMPSQGADLVSGIGMFNLALPEGDEKLDFETPSVNLLRQYMIDAMKLRVLDIPEPPTSTDTPASIDIRVAILFSGGLDCTVLARMADEMLPASQGIDLINVAFQNPRVAAQHKIGNGADDSYEKCPDRQTGRKAFAELRTACPTRLWRFIAVNVPFEEAMAHKAQVVSLIYPHDTEMDLSIALALYFAGRGVGNCYTTSTEFDDAVPVASTPARVLLSGLGADELFGGYSRHIKAFEMQGYKGLVDELKLDIARIGHRNLGRDDRVLARWGKEVRFPYLDEDLVRFAITTPVWEKCDFGNPAHSACIEPAKRVLRLVADQLHLPTIARERKRAIQFGSRTAKLGSTTGRLKGTASINSVA